MKIYISALPQNPWWGNGTPQYDDNPAMVKGTIPDQSRVRLEWNQLQKSLNETTVRCEVVPFPVELDSTNTSNWKHDYVFFRDLFLSNQNGKVVLANFREKERQAETEIVAQWLNTKPVEILRLPHDKNCFMEGGEFYFCPNENVLFAGESRNSQQGNDKTAELLNVNELVILKSNAFHLDTLFTPVFNKTNQLCLLIACTDLLEKESVEILKRFAQNRNIPLLEVPPSEAIGTADKLGSFAVNCLPLPGILLGAAAFVSEAVKLALAEHKITHTIVPLSQFRLSGGSVHCLTNEL